jgi:hypothetical protein
MKRFVCLPTFLISMGLILTSQYGCAKPPANTGSTNVATPESTPDTNAITAELTRIESDWPRIVKERDSGAIKRIEADDAVIVSPDGSISSKEQDVKDIESGAITADSWEVTDIKVEVLNKDAAVVTGRSIVKNGKYNNQVFPADQFRWVDTYARRQGQWQLVAGATTPLPKGTAAATPKPSPSASPMMKSSPSPRPSPAAKSSPTMKMPPAPSPKKTP